MTAVARHSAHARVGLWFIMLHRLRQRPLFRALFTVAVAVIVIARGGPLATVCDALTSRHASHETGAAPGHDMAGMKGMTSHDQGSKGCDTREKPRECSLMVACAPALSATTTPRDMLPPQARVIAVAHLDAPAPVDRSPDPPPPRV